MKAVVKKQQTVDSLVESFKGANVHAPVGKLSFTVDQLVENTKSVIDSVVKNKPQSSKGTYIKSLTLTATMAPGIKLDMALTR